MLFGWWVGGGQVVLVRGGSGDPSSGWGQGKRVHAPVHHVIVSSVSFLPLRLEVQLLMLVVGGGAYVHGGGGAEPNMCANMANMRCDVPYCTKYQPARLTD